MQLTFMLHYRIHGFLLMNLGIFKAAFLNGGFNPFARS